MKMDIKIDPEFAALIPPLSAEELVGLEASIAVEGCRDALVTWQEYEPGRCVRQGRGVCKDDNCKYGRNRRSPPVSSWVPDDGVWHCPECDYGLLPIEDPTLLDGHNRKAICDRLGLPYKTTAIELPDREAAMDWIDANQLGRRNLSPEQMSLIRGRMYERMKKAAGFQSPGPGRGKTLDQNEPVFSTAEKIAAKTGVSPATVKRDAAFTKAVDALEAGPAPGIRAKVLAGKGPTRERVVQAAKFAVSEPKKAKAMLDAPAAHVSHNSGDNEWYTPVEIIKTARQVMGGIDLDPASSEEANAVVKADTFFTAEQDGLKQAWRGAVWLNPPFAGELIGRFAQKLVDSETVAQAVVLVNNATETRWFQLLLTKAACLCLPAGRVKFWHPRKVATPLQGQAILYFGPHKGKFHEQFKHFGAVCDIVH